MTTTMAAVRVDQCATLRRQLQEQRLLITQRLGPPPEANKAYPRSMTMRFLIKRSDLIGRTIVEIASLLIGGRCIKTVRAVMNLSRIARANPIS